MNQSEEDKYIKPIMKGLFCGIIEDVCDKDYCEDCIEWKKYNAEE